MTKGRLSSVAVNMDGELLVVALPINKGMKITNQIQCHKVMSSN